MTLSNEPVAVGTAFVMFANAVVQLGQLLDVYSLTGDQLAGVNLVLVTGVTFVAAVFTRRKVTPGG